LKSKKTSKCVRSFIFKLVSAETRSELRYVLLLSFLWEAYTLVIKKSEKLAQKLFNCERNVKSPVQQTKEFQMRLSLCASRLMF
jgi:hypothetical protein